MLHLNAKDEQTTLMVRKHWFILLSRTLAFGLLFYLPFLLYDAISHQTAITVALNLTPITLSPELLSFLGTAWALFVWIKLFGFWTDYSLDLWIVTDKRVIAIDQIRFFNRRMAIFRMERIQDVAVHVHGPIETILNFGDLHVETAGADENFIMHNLPNPARVKDAIMHEHDKAIEHSNRTQAAAGL